jgi:hypothetical protein
VAAALLLVARAAFGDHAPLVAQFGRRQHATQLVQPIELFQHLCLQPGHQRPEGVGTGEQVLDQEPFRLLPEEIGDHGRLAHPLLARRGHRLGVTSGRH